MKGANFHVGRLIHCPQRVSLLVLLASAQLLSGCGAELASECRTSRDCAPAQFCRLSRCVYLGADDTPEPSQNHSPFAEDDAGHTLDDAAAPSGADASLPEPDAPPTTHPCPEAVPATAGLLIIHELLPNVPTGPSGDANADGTRDAHDDEFVELVNISPHTLDLEGVQVANDTRPRFTFAQTCLPPGHGAVIFAGSTTDAPPPDRDDAIFRLADTRFQFANSGGRAVLLGAAGEVIDEVIYDNAPARSLNRSPELRTSPFAHHTDLAPERPFSPGTCADGQPLSSGCLPPENESDEPSSDPSLSDAPPSGNGDPPPEENTPQNP
ncbi:hypothetical protein DL240_04120 [Lujinxingia litoralis]|uniref:LTD domain-containing protein n=1 Tax=Lujinxingia litoralis TaxID=2211119 RepID=A0A328CAA7_9DELT|nr:lamin tail domain-containing protein [Lujinxingia litoralis]RAL25405.1 hypothetical protein DL240_04120 [Lujinxingia litoralis]